MTQTSHPTNASASMGDTLKFCNRRAWLGCDYGQNLETQPSTFDMGEAMLEPPATVEVANNLDWWNINKGRLARQLGGGLTDTAKNATKWPRTSCTRTTRALFSLKRMAKPRVVNVRSTSTFDTSL
jgi:hypothetical protein